MLFLPTLAGDLATSYFTFVCLRSRNRKSQKFTLQDLGKAKQIHTVYKMNVEHKIIAVLDEIRPFLVECNSGLINLLVALEPFLQQQDVDLLKRYLSLREEKKAWDFVIEVLKTSGTNVFDVFRYIIATNQYFSKIRRHFEMLCNEMEAPSSKTKAKLAEGWLPGANTYVDDGKLRTLLGLQFLSGRGSHSITCM